MRNTAVRIISRQIVCLFLLSSLSTAVLAELRGDKLIRVRAEPWQKFTHADGSGYFYELLKAVYQPLGYQLEFEFCPWRRCMLDVMQGKADIVVGVYGDEPKVGNKGLQTPIYPIHQERNAVAFKRSRWPGWQGQETLANQAVAQPKGYGLTARLAVPVNVAEYINHEQAWQMLLTDEVGFILNGIAVLERECKERGLSPELIRIEPVFENRSYLGYSENNKGAELLAVFEQRLPQLYQQNIPQQLQQKWQLRWPILLTKMPKDTK